MPGSGDKEIKGMDLAFKDFIVKEEIKIKTGIKIPPAICKKWK